MHFVGQHYRVPTLLASLLVWPLLVTASGDAIAQTELRNGERIVVPLSNPEQPAMLDIELFNGSVSVTGYDGDEIIIETLSGGRNQREQPSRVANTEGLRRIGNTSMGLTAEEDDNVVEIRAGAPFPASVAITVPQQTSVRASTVNGTNMSVENVYGEHELSNVNGGINANDIGGTLIANATNGPIEIVFTEVFPDRAMSFTTFNGFIDVTLPAGTDADLRISTNRGEILTDFDVEVQPGQTSVERDDNGGRFRVTLNQDVHATVGDGGPEYRFRTFNGDIVIRSQ